MIELIHLEAGYAGKGAVRDVHTQIYPGQLTMILGRNGAGKTTLIKTILGLLPPVHGTVRIDNRNLEDFPLMERARKMAYVKQERNVPAMTVRQLVLHGRFPYLSWPRRYRTSDLEAAGQAIQKMDIAALRNRRLDTLSGGERQKASIAMALAQQSDYIFFDEPASYMDIPSQLELTRIMKDLVSDGKGIVVVEHDLIHALEYADHILILDDHQLIFSGSPEALLHTDLPERIFQIRIVQTEIQGRIRYVYDSLF